MDITEIRLHGGWVDVTKFVVSFICNPCGKGEHINCPGEGQCDCQHRAQPKKEEAK